MVSADSIPEVRHLLRVVGNIDRWRLEPFYADWCWPQWYRGSGGVRARVHAVPFLTSQGGRVVCNVKLVCADRGAISISAGVFGNFAQWMLIFCNVSSSRFIQEPSSPFLSVPFEGLSLFMRVSLRLCSCTPPCVCVRHFSACSYGFFLNST